MKKYLQEKFQLTDKGADGLYKASISHFFYYISFIAPVMLVMSFSNYILNNINPSPVHYVVGIAISTIIMYIIANINYKVGYNETYKESANLRTDIADRLRKLPLSYFSKHDISDMAQTIMADVYSIEHALSHAIGSSIGFFMYFVIASILLISGNYKLGLVILIPIAVSVILLFLSKKAQTDSRKVQYDKLREISENFQSSIELSQEIKAYNLKESTLDKIEKNLDEAEKMQWDSEMVQIVPLVICGDITQLSLGFCVALGSYLLLKGEISFIILVGYILVAAKMCDGISGIYSYISEIFYLDARIKRMKEIRSQAVQCGKEAVLDNFDIEFKNVDFSYDSDKKVIDNISFKAGQNEVTSLVGPSGCGKTTILRLISRLYDYDGGSITVGGVDIKDIDTECLFKNLSIVFQDVILFNTSVLENIRIGNINASDEEVKEAARLSGCEEIIEKLPDGYDTVIGENGAKLSGGERQRISIARAFLKNAPIIILDEIAASLDVENEVKIQESLTKLIKGKTVITISHRLKSVENTDKIVVLENGKINAIGKHEELLNISNLYKSMVEKSRLTEEFRY